MTAIAPLLLCLLFAPVEVHSQIVPYLTVMGNNIPNHSYVDLNTVGTYFNSKNVQCHSDLNTCCSGVQGPDRGDWFFPNGNRLPFSGNVSEGRGPQRVSLQYTGSGGTSGIYRCDIETVAVNDNDGNETVYVGLYTSGGECSLLLLNSIIIIFIHIFIVNLWRTCAAKVIVVILCACVCVYVCRQQRLL